MLLGYSTYQNNYYFLLTADYRNNGDNHPYSSGGHEEVILDYPPPGYGDHHYDHNYDHNYEHYEHPPEHDHEHIEYRKSSKAYRRVNGNYYPNYGTGNSYSSYARSIGNVLGDNVNIVKDVVKRCSMIHI